MGSVLLIVLVLIAFVDMAPLSSTEDELDIDIDTTEAPPLERSREPTVELAVFVDYWQWKRIVELEKGDQYGADQILRRLVAASVGEAQLLLWKKSVEPRVTIRVVHYEVWKQQPVELSDTSMDRVGPPGEDTANIEKLLQTFCESVSSRRKWDVAVLITGIAKLSDAIDSLDGLASYGSACGESACIVVANLLKASWMLPSKLLDAIGLSDDDAGNAGTLPDSSACVLEKRWNASLLLDLHPGASFPVRWMCQYGKMGGHEFGRRGDADWCRKPRCTDDETIWTLPSKAWEKSECSDFGHWCIDGECIQKSSPTLQHDSHLQGYHLYQGRHCVGHNYRGGVEALAVEECAGVCTADPRCKGFSWFPRSPEGACWPKNVRCENPNFSIPFEQYYVKIRQN